MKFWALTAGPGMDYHRGRQEPDEPWDIGYLGVSSLNSAWPCDDSTDVSISQIDMLSNELLRVGAESANRALIAVRWTHCARELALGSMFVMDKVRTGMRDDTLCNIAKICLFLACLQVPAAKASQSMGLCWSVVKFQHS